jgi:hypothetical protein
VTNARATYTTRAAAGATGTRLSLRPLIFEGHEIAKLGRIAPRDRESVSTSLRGALATKQSILSFFVRQDGLLR